MTQHINRKHLLLLVPLVATLAACSGSTAEAINVCNPINIDVDDEGNVTTPEWTEDEEAAMAAACEAGKELQGEDLQPLLDAINADFFYEDYDETVCPTFETAADAIDRMGFLAENANNTTMYITGEAIRWDQLDALKTACADEISDWRQATAKHS